MRRTALAALCIAAAATVTLTGCLPGTDKADSESKGPFAGLTGGEIADRAVEATKGATSLRLKGEVPDEESGGTIRIDMALSKKGDCAGTMSMNGGRTELIKTGDTVYLKFDEAFLRAQSEGSSEEETEAVVDMLAGKWTKTAATGTDAKDLASFCDLDTVLSEFEDVNSDAERGATTTVDGTPAIALHEQDGKDRDTAYVATEGKPYLLRVVSKSAKDPGDITFTDYDKPVPAEAPKGKVLDLDAMGG
ncbi:hypothetical protein ACFS5L_41850 [Streptomyces phyllanthi]|uniref:Lipoprotein n=1 Tax=Streptomyces phyllanthi TaxID=1803180 RepID=A0A5N8WH06_9ACTN|nr:hypothetical protein [Streptomyces phyllanthi]MPY46422.1 hypothetical protein [Streptomyces phyllanthi]